MTALVRLPGRPIETPIRVLIVDDEPTARRRVARLLSELPNVTVVGALGSSREALSAIRADSPDLILLDIAMPEVDGLSLARRLGGQGRAASPLVVFVTAYDEHALDAFQLHATDYVLKPVGRHRLRDAVEHARVSIRRARAERAALAVAEGTTGPGAATPRLAVRDGYRTHIVPLADILWVESCGNYTRVHTAVARYTHRATMVGLADELTPRGFARIHRSAIINAARVVRLQPRRNGQYEVVLDTGIRLRVSRTYRGAVEAAWRRGEPGTENRPSQ